MRYGRFYGRRFAYDVKIGTMNTNANVTRWMWVRHFPTNASGIYVGQTDKPAEVPPVCLPHTLNIPIVDPAKIVWLASPLMRAQQTMRWLKQSLKLPDNEYTIVPELMEQHFGLWEGKRYDDIHDQMDWSQAESIQPPEGESFLDVIGRVHAWLVQAMEDYAGYTVVAVCHAGPIRAALAYTLTSPASAALRFHLDYASLTQMTYFQHQNSWSGRVESVNTPIKRG